MENNTIFAVVCSAAPNLHSTKFFFTKEGAQKYLKSAGSERKNKLGIHCFEEKEDSFSYLIGWEEHKVTFAIMEFHVE